MMQYFQVAYRDWADIHGIFGRLSAELRTSTLPPKNAPCPYISEVLRGARIYSYHRTQIQEDQPIRSPVYWPNFVWNHASHWRALPRQKGKDKLYTLLLKMCWKSEKFVMSEIYFAPKTRSPAEPCASRFLLAVVSNNNKSSSKTIKLDGLFTKFIRYLKRWWKF